MDLLFFFVVFLCFWGVGFVYLFGSGDFVCLCFGFVGLGFGGVFGFGFVSVDFVVFSLINFKLFITSLLGNNQWRRHVTGCNMYAISFFDQDSESGFIYSGHKYAVITSLIFLFSA